MGCKQPACGARSLRATVAFPFPQLQKLRREAERAKRALSSQHQVRAGVPRVCGWRQLHRQHPCLASLPV